MNKIKSYSDFCNEEINIKKTLAGLALGTSLAFGNPSVGNTQISKNIENTQSKKSEEVKDFSNYRYSLKTDQKFGFNFYKTRNLGGKSDVSDDLIYKDFLKGERYNQTKITKGISEIINSHKFSPASVTEIDLPGEPIVRNVVDGQLKRVFIVDDFDFKKDEIDELKSSMGFSNKDWKNLIKSKTINTKMPFIVWDTKKYKSKKYDWLSGWNSDVVLRNTFYFINKNDLKEIKKDLINYSNSKIISKFDLYKLITKLTDYGIIKDHETEIQIISKTNLNEEIVEEIIKDAENQIDALLEYGIITKDKFFDNTNNHDINLLENTEVSKNDTLKIVDFSKNNKVIKLEKKDGSIVYFNGGMNYFLEYFDQKFDDKYIAKLNIAKEKAISDFIKYHIKNSFPNQNIGKTTVISNIGKVKIIGTDDLKFENIEKEILNINWHLNLDLYAFENIEIATKLNNFIDENSKVLLQKENGEKISITIKRFKSDDLGTGPLRFGKDLQDLINGKIKIGMNQDMIDLAIGQPTDIDRQTGTKYEEIYIYKSRDFRKSGDGYYLGYSKYDNTYLSFEDGILKSIMDR